MDLRRRLLRLETTAAARGMRELPWVTLTEDLDVPGVFVDDLDMYHFRRGERSKPPERYTEADFPELEKHCRLILVCWDQVRQAAEADHRAAAASPQW